MKRFCMLFVVAAMFVLPTPGQAFQFPVNEFGQPVGRGVVKRGLASRLMGAYLAKKGISALVKHPLRSALVVVGAGVAVGVATSLRNKPEAEEEECVKIKDEMVRFMYGNKRRVGSPDDIHGLQYRRIEQKCGQYGPGMVALDGIKKPWDTHADVIARMQFSLQKLSEQYRKKSCSRFDKASMQLANVKQMTDKAYNPSDREWNPNHSDCIDIKERIKEGRY
jgi:hypothetical protein